MRKAFWTLALGALASPACSSHHKLSPSRAELLSRPVFAKSLTLADSSTSAKSVSSGFQLMSANSSGGDPCSAAMDPLIQQAQQGISDLNSSVADSNSALSAATGGNAAAMTALMAAATQMMQNNSSAGSTPSAAATPVASTADPSAPSPVSPGTNGHGGFEAGTEDPRGGAGFTNGTQDPNHPGGPANSNGGTQDSRGTSNGGAGAVAGTSGGAAGFLGSAGEAHSAGSSLSDHAGMHTASVAVSESEGFGGYASATGAAAGSSDSPATPHPARGLASLSSSTPPDLPILHLDGFQDVANKYSPNIFSLLSQSYGGYCRAKNISRN